MEEDIKILEELKDDVELGFGGWVNRLRSEEKQALENLLKEYEELKENNERLIIEKATALQEVRKYKEMVKGYKDRVEELKQEITVLQNTKDTCPSLNTSGVRCDLKTLSILEERCAIAEGNLKTTKEELRDYVYNYIPKSKIKEIRDKAEVMDYYTLPDVIEDLNKLLEEE